MISAFFLPPKTREAQALGDPATILEAFRRTEGLLWIDVESAAPDEVDLLGEGFGFHPITVDICREVTAQPMVHDFDDYLFMVIHAVDFAQQEEAVATLEVDIFWSKHFVLTYHRDPVRTITEMRERCAASGGGAAMSRGTDLFLHTLLDRIIDNFTPTLEHIDDAIEEVEARIFADPSDEVLQRALKLKRAVGHLARVATAQRDVVGRIVRGEFPHVAKQSLAYWRDAYDHLVRMVQATDVQRDLIAATRDTYLSVVSNRMNEIMKVLTIIATIFIPLTFVAGVYGMNFEHMPELHWPWAYAAVWAVMVLVGLAMFAWFRRKKWL